jgi:hypothetical protein
VNRKEWTALGSLVEWTMMDLAQMVHL